MKVYILIDLESVVKSCVEGVYATPEYAHFRAKEIFAPDTHYRVEEAQVESPGAGFVVVDKMKSRNELIGNFWT